jgi:bifunctional DNA-binding transcriptional regulator/antitoxin component of YhaV-PrlF toxin-antitoxin module
MIFSRGRIVLPAPLREQDGIRLGDEFTVERIDRGEYRLVRQQPIPNDGVVEWLLSCPEKGFFVPIDSGSADSL